MSEKKELNLEELEKINGGFHEADDPKVGTEVELKYGRNGKKKIKARVLKCGYLDVYNPGQKMYLLDVNNGWLKGWFRDFYLADYYYFISKDDIKNLCVLEENIGWYDQPHPDWEGAD